MPPLHHYHFLLLPCSWHPVSQAAGAWRTLQTASSVPSPSLLFLRVAQGHLARIREETTKDSSFPSSPAVTLVLLLKLPILQHLSTCPHAPCLLPPTSTSVLPSPSDGPSPQLTAGSGAPGCREGCPRGLACALWLDSFLLFTRRWKERVSRLSGLHKQWEQQ